MDKARFSRIAHQRLPWSAPVSARTLERLIEALELDPESLALDIGCGRGRLLLDIVARHRCLGVGVDPDSISIHFAREQAASRGLSALTTFLSCPADKFSCQKEFDLCICVGACHACGGYRQTLEYLLEKASPSAYLLVGEGFWRHPPEPEYLDQIGATSAELGSHRDNLEVAASLGLTPAWCAVTSNETWDEYEGLYRLTMLQFLDRNPDDEDCAAFRAHSDTWYDGYLRWGRDTMGFALYLFRRGAGSGKTSGQERS